MSDNHHRPPSKHSAAAVPTAPRVHLFPVRTDDDFQRFIGQFTNYERLRFYRYGEEALSLERMEGLAADLGRPDAAYPCVHIAGTKGKGTTSLILEALLQASGHAVGTYTSPHVEHVGERIRCGGGPISTEDLCALTNSLHPVLEARWERGPAEFPTFFELMTALAMLQFKARGVGWGVFEVGLGGRLDATNILRPRWTAITSIGLEHTDKLGNTLDGIAREKAGIVKPGVPLVLGRLPPGADGEVRRIARERGAPVLDADPAWVRPAGPGLLECGGPGLGWSAGPFPSGAVRGPALRTDLAIALRLWQGVLEGELRQPRPEDIRRALERLRLPARVEVMGGDPPVVIDGAHTRESIEALRLALEEIRFPRPRSLVFALSSDKSAEPIIRELAGLAEEAIFTRADPVRGRDPEDLLGIYREAVSGDARAVEDPAEAFALARAGGRAIVATGSFYLAGRLRPLAMASAGPGIP